MTEEKKKEEPSVDGKKTVGGINSAIDWQARQRAIEHLFFYHSVWDLANTSGITFFTVTFTASAQWPGFLER